MPRPLDSFLNSRFRQETKILDSQETLYFGEIYQNESEKIMITNAKISLDKKKFIMKPKVQQPRDKTYEPQG